MAELILIKPSEDYLKEIESYRTEFITDDPNINGSSGLQHYEDVRTWIEQCRLGASRDTLPKPEWVESDQYMLVEMGNKKILGMIAFRHYLNDLLAEYAGHIGYGVRPTERRKGYSKKMLNLCLERCGQYGLQRVLITCDEGNMASRKTILACGGNFERLTRKKVDGKYRERYWLTITK